MQNFETEMCFGKAVQMLVPVIVLDPIGFHAIR